MVAMGDSSSVKVYTVNGAASGSSSSLPDWLTRKRAAKKGKRALREHVQGTIDLVQEFEFPEASIKIKTTRDGHHAIATGVYKPQMRVYDLDQLTLKFERHSDAENVDFIVSECPGSSWKASPSKHRDRSFRMTGQRPYTSRLIGQSNCTPKAASTTGLEYPGLVEQSTTISLLVTHTSVLADQRSTD